MTPFWISPNRQQDNSLDARLKHNRDKKIILFWLCNIIQTVDGKYFANENRGACGSSSRRCLQLFVAPPLDPPDPRFQCCLDLCCALAKYFPLLAPSFFMGVTLLSTLKSGGEGGNRVEHQKRDLVFTCEILSVNSPQLHHFFEKTPMGSYSDAT